MRHTRLTFAAVALLGVLAPTHGFGQNREPPCIRSGRCIEVTAVPAKANQLMVGVRTAEIR